MTMKKLRFQDKFIIRTPIFSLDNIPNFESQWASLDHKFEDSLFLASPNLLDRIKEKQEDKVTKDVHKLKLACFKYWTRAHMRCTPYGLFAACHIGAWGEKNNLQVPPTDQIDRHTNLDMNFLCMLGKHLEQHKDIINQSKFYSNTSTYRSDNTIRFIYYTYDDNNNRTHQLNSVELNQYVEKILSKAKKGATLHTLATALVDEDITKEEALAYLHQFVQAQLLVSDFEVAIAGQAYIDQIITVLKTLKNQTPYIKQTHQFLIQIKTALTKLDQKKFNTREDYFEIIALVKQLNLPYDISKLFQTNTYKVPLEIPILTKNLQKELLYTIDFLEALIPLRPNTDLEDFVGKFHERYEERKVKLLDALDVETGIGFPINNASPVNNPIVRGIFGNTKSVQEQEIKWGKYEAFLMELIERSQQTKAIEIDLKPERKALRFNDKITKDFPATVYLMGNILGTNEKGDVQFLFKHVGGSSSINLLSRFAHGSTEIAEIIKSAIAFEQSKNEGRILAEIIHLPQARTGNILKHPQFLDHEICYLGKPSVPDENNLALDDLELFMEGRNRIVLWSKKHLKEVIPRLSNAHNYSGSALPVYRFLSALQNHRIKSGLSFSWGALANLFHFLPRIKFGNIILSQAQWFVKKEKYEALIKKHRAADVSKYKDFQTFRSTCRLPERFLLIEGDNQLLIDSQSELSIDMFLDVIKNKENIKITEFLFDQYDNISKDKQGHAYTNEVIVPLFNEHVNLPNAQNIPDDINIPAFYPPGSEWIYFKIYCGHKTADIILTEYIKPFIDSIKERPFFDKWFFIRYQDPEHHIRLRIKVKSIEQIGTIQHTLYKQLQKLVDDDIIHNIMLDTYKREVKRYGLKTMDLSEDYFHSDSENILHFLSRIEGEEGEMYRWQYALVRIDSLLNAFNYTLAEKSTLLKQLTQNFGAEFGMGKNTKKGLDKKFRKHKETIHALLQHQLLTEDYQEFYEIIRKEEASNKPTYQAILNIYEQGSKQPTLANLISSYIHMLCNRVFIGNQRFHEFVLYSLLSKYYTTEFNRQKYHTKHTIQQ